MVHRLIVANFFVTGHTVSVNYVHELGGGVTGELCNFHNGDFLELLKRVHLERHLLLLSFRPLLHEVRIDHVEFFQAILNSLEEGHPEFILVVLSFGGQVVPSVIRSLKYSKSGTSDGRLVGALIEDTLVVFKSLFHSEVNLTLVFFGGVFQSPFLPSVKVCLSNGFVRSLHLLLVFNINIELINNY